MSENDDPRIEHLRRISIGKSHVKFDPPIVFLFGGVINKVTDPPSTVRALVYSHLLQHHSGDLPYIIVPEDFKDWLHDSVYPDLLTFESDLAQTSSLVVIALESEGAIAELGAFSVNDDLKEKVLIIIQEGHHNADSFIKLGPLRQLIEENIYAYPFVYADIHSTESLSECIADACKNVVSTATIAGKEAPFNGHNSGHVAFLIYELILIFRALKLREISTFLAEIGIDTYEGKIKRLLFLLVKIGLVEKTKRGKSWYYLSLVKDSRLTISSVEGSLFDRKAASLSASEYYARIESESMRHSLIKAKAEGFK